MLISGETNIAKANAAQDGPLEAPDRQRGRQILSGLADDQLADAILRPIGLEEAETGTSQNQEKDDEADERAGRRANDPTDHYVKILSIVDVDQVALVAIRPDEREQAIEVERFLQHGVRGHVPGTALIERGQHDDRNGG